MLTLDPFDALALSVHQNPGVYALLVGSGLSRAAGIPTGWEITLKLIERLGAVCGAGNQNDWAQWYRDSYNEEPSYSNILDALAPTRAERRNILHSYIEPRTDDEMRRPTKAHHAIAQLVANGHVRVIITPNFDRLVETALREAGIEPTVIASEDAASGATPIIHSPCTVIKVHGDYLDSRIRNTHAELVGYPPILDRLLDEVFDRFGLITVGWSGEWDDALRLAIRRTPARRYPFFWVSRGSTAQLARDLIEERDGKVVTAAGADEFFSRLADVLDALKKTERPHPQSVAVVVALAKKYCREGRYSLEWAELLAGEVAKIRSVIDQKSFAKPSLDGDNVKNALELLADCSEGFRRLCMICGRWGTIENKIVSVRAIRSLVHENTLSGLVAWSDVRDIPAGLGFYWFAAGALQANDYEMLCKLFHEKINHNESEIALIERLPLHNLSSDIWSRLGGFRWYSWSGWLHSLYLNESRDIALAGPDTEVSFDDLEFLIAVEAAGVRLARVDREKKGFFEFPLGRFVIHGLKPDVFDRLAALKRLRPEDVRFQMGLFGGTIWSVQSTADHIEKELRAHPSVRMR